MSVLVIPNVLVNGNTPANIVDAVGLNANFTAIATAVNNIYPSQVLPLTAAQATFGATATGVGYKFLANDATATPLTVSGVSGQSSDIFDVTLTSGGTKAAYVTALGHLAFGAIGGVGDTSLPYVSADGGATIGMIFNVPTGSTNGYRFLVNGAAVAAVSSNGLITSSVAAGANGVLRLNSNVSTTATLETGGSGTLGPINANELALVDSSTGTLLALSNGGNFAVAGQMACSDGVTSTIAYVPPVYTTAGAATASTMHIVTGQATTSSSNAVTVTLSGAAAFASSSSYQVIATEIGGGGATINSVTYNSGTSFTITISSVGTFPIAYIAIGT